NVEEVLALVVAELDALAERGISEDELSRAKGNVRADTWLGLEDSGTRMSRMGVGLLLFDEVMSVDEQLARVDAVTTADVAKLASSVLGSQRLLAVVGPFAKEDFAPLSLAP
ncbi:MAG TPA: hypothetical protein VKR27_05900, partial [Acidimicrobiales bacterium]|nr:hypothetical protein [Acidimicrobiales bacterium]